MVKAAFFDIDGTLLPFGYDRLPDSCREALDALRKKGVKLFIATGRCAPQMKTILPILDYHFDGFVTLNGQYCYDDNGMIHHAPIPDSDLKGLKQWHLEHPDAIACLDERDRRWYNPSYARRQGWSFGEMELAPVSDMIDNILEQGRHLYQLSATYPASQDDALLAYMPGCTAVRWHPDHVDIIPKTGGKCVGIGKVLAHYGLTFADCIAFGDGGNDISMLKAAAIGIAMGNAGDEVKANADFVTTDADKDGIRHALTALGLL